MPCCKESFLLLEQSVTVGSKEVDSLVARIGEALQLNAHRAPTSCNMAYGGALKPAAIPRPSTMCSCVRGRSAPYQVCTHRGAARRHCQPGGGRHCSGSTKQLRRRGWIRRKYEEEGAGARKLLQELLLSGNLIKEAVRRLQLAGEADSTATDSMDCSVSETTETTIQ